MSTKIYEAYKLDENVTMTELMVMLRQLKKEYIQKCVEFVIRTKGDSDFTTISSELKKCLSSSERSHYNFGASVVVYHFEDKTYVQLFGLDFTAGDAYSNLMSVLTDYHYQNQSDAWYEFEFDEGKITQEEYDAAEIDYEERKRVWEGIYGDSWKPSECGLYFDLCNKDDYYKISGKAFNYDGFGD